MTNRLEDEVRQYQLRVLLAERGIEHHEHDDGRIPYDEAMTQLIREGMKYPQHVWKPVYHWYEKHRQR